MTRTIGLVALLSLTGCIQVYQRQARFNEAEFAPFTKTGSASLSGQAFLKTVSGDVKYGAGNLVYLIPVTKYTQEWYQVGLLQGQPMSDADPRLPKYLRNTQADGEGRFKFSNLPGGEYIAACDIVWGVAGPYGVTYTGGTAFAKVKIGPGEQASVVVTR